MNLLLLYLSTFLLPRAERSRTYQIRLYSRHLYERHRCQYQQLGLKHQISFVFSDALKSDENHYHQRFASSLDSPIQVYFPPCVAGDCFFYDLLDSVNDMRPVTMILGYFFRLTCCCELCFMSLIGVKPWKLSSETLSLASPGFCSRDSFSEPRSASLRKPLIIFDFVGRFCPSLPASWQRSSSAYTNTDATQKPQQTQED